jgi:hypothetical protein
MQGVPNQQSASRAGENIFTTTDIPSKIQGDQYSYTWQSEDIVAESNCAYRPGHRGIQIETKVQKVEGGQVARPVGRQDRRGARLADERTFRTRGRVAKCNTQKEAYNTRRGANQEPK